MKLYELSSGDIVQKTEDIVFIRFCEKRRVLSTSVLNGGLREDITCVFNHSGRREGSTEYVMRAPTYEEHLRVVVSEDLKMDARYVTGLSTSARVENTAIRELKGRGFTVTAIATGGILVNGGRAGDPADWDEGKPVCGGTINLIVYIDGNLPEGVLSRALITATEAKCAALQELLASSRYSSGIATGSGTDGAIIVCNPQAERLFTDAGNHNVLGEYIARTVKDAVKEALYLQSGMNEEFQHSVSKRVERFGITDEILYDYMKKHGKADLTVAEFEAAQKQETAVLYASLYAHLLDQCEWKLITKEEMKKAVEKLNLGFGVAGSEDFLESVYKLMYV